MKFSQIFWVYGKNIFQSLQSPLQQTACFTFHIHAIQDMGKCRTQRHNHMLTKTHFAQVLQNTHLLKFAFLCSGDLAEGSLSRILSIYRQVEYGPGKVMIYTSYKIAICKILVGSEISDSYSSGKESIFESRAPGLKAAHGSDQYTFSHS